jgi:hypothetical protein
MNGPDSGRLDRRAALKWMMAGTAALMVTERAALAQGAASPASRGYGSDPDLIRSYQPGELWPLSFNDHQRRTATALCDVIIPAEGTVPSAGDLKVQDFIDEWISAPYPTQVADRPRILRGLEWIDGESQRRFQRGFADLSPDQKTAICDDICRVAPPDSPLHEPSHFFRRFRDLTASGFYTTPEGARDAGYVGNVPLATFDGPPPEVLRRLGLE